MGRWMRKMSREMGEDLGPEFDEVVGRLEAGEDPEEIERSMPDLMGEGGGDLGGELDI
jgi:Flp pilus assembly protein TadB